MFINVRTSCQFFCDAGSFYSIIITIRYFLNVTVRSRDWNHIQAVIIVLLRHDFSYLTGCHIN